MNNDFFDIKWNPIDVDYDEQLKLIEHRLKIPGSIKGNKKILVNGEDIDIFSPLVDSSWIGRVLGHMEIYDGHTFILVTKYPERCKDFNPYPKNVWVGMRASTQAEYIKDKHIKKVIAPFRFIWFQNLKESIRPALGGIDWVIIGEDDKPNHIWISNLLSECMSYTILIFVRPPIDQRYKRKKEFPVRVRRAYR